MPIVTKESLEIITANATKVVPVGERSFFARKLHKYAFRANLIILASTLFIQSYGFVGGMISKVKDAPALDPAPVVEVAGTKNNDYPKDDFKSLQKAISEKGLSMPESIAVYIAVAEAGKTLFVGRGSEELVAARTKELVALNGFLSDSTRGDFSNPPTQVIQHGVKYENLSDATWPELERSWTCMKDSWACMDSSINTINSIDVPVELTMAQAKKELSDAVIETGLAGVYVPIQIADNPDEIYILAKQLKMANKDLQLMTGWDGAVLGLNGRVVLDFSQKGTSAVTRKDVQTGLLHITSSWENLAHEWHHAMDWAMMSSIQEKSWIPQLKTGLLSSSISDFDNSQNTKVKAKDPFNLYSAQAELWQSINNPDLSSQERLKIMDEAVKQSKWMSRYRKNVIGEPMFEAVYDYNIKTVKSTPNEGSPWMYWREEAASKVIGHQASSDYLTSPVEVLAFSFSGSFSAQMRARRVKSNLDDVDFGTKFMPSYQPTVTESLNVSKDWVEFFSETKSFWLSDQVKRGFDFGDNGPRSRPKLSQDI